MHVENLYGLVMLGPSRMLGIQTDQPDTNTCRTWSGQQWRNLLCLNKEDTMVVALLRSNYGIYFSQTNGNYYYHYYYDYYYYYCTTATTMIVHNNKNLPEALHNMHPVWHIFTILGRKYRQHFGVIKVNYYLFFYTTPGQMSFFMFEYVYMHDFIKVNS